MAKAKKITKEELENVKNLNNKANEKYGDVSIDLKDGSIKSIDEVENGK
jgi:hypothetical protein